MPRNLKSFVVMGVFLAIWSLNSCSENQPVDASGALYYPNVAHGPLNTSNPFDSLGIEHNILCEYEWTFIRSIDTTFEQKVDRIRLAIEELGDSLGWSTSETEALLDSCEAYANGRDSTKTAIDLLKSASSDDGITALETQYIRDIGEAFDEATDSSDLMNRFIQIENQMANENWDDGEDHALRTIAVAKHSFAMWFGMDYWTFNKVICIASEDARIELWIPRNYERRDILIGTHSMLASCDWEPGKTFFF